MKQKALKSFLLLIMPLALGLTGCKDEGEVIPENYKEIVDEVCEELSLPSVIISDHKVAAKKDGATITWTTTSSKVRVTKPVNDECVIKVERSVYDNVEANVKATVSYSDYQKEKDFVFTITNKNNYDDDALNEARLTNYVERYTVPFGTTLNEDLHLANEAPYGIKTTWQHTDSKGNIKEPGANPLIIVTNNEDGTSDIQFTRDKYTDKKSQFLTAFFTLGNSTNKVISPSLTIQSLGFTKFENVVEVVHGELLHKLPDYLPSEYEISIPINPSHSGLKLADEHFMKCEVTVSRHSQDLVYIDDSNENYTKYVLNNPLDKAAFIEFAIKYNEMGIDQSEVEENIEEESGAIKVLNSIPKTVLLLISQAGATTPRVINEINSVLVNTNDTYTLALEDTDPSIIFASANEQIDYNFAYDNTYLNIDTETVNEITNEHVFTLNPVRHPYLDKTIDVKLTMSLFDGLFTYVKEFKVIVISLGEPLPEYDDMVVYETKFESEEGFATTSPYTSASEKFSGPEGKQWAFTHGGITSAAAYNFVVDKDTGTQNRYSKQSATVRHAKDNTVDGTYYMRTTFKIERPISVTFYNYFTSKPTIIISYSNDGVSWMTGGSFEAKSYSYFENEITIVLPETLINGNYYFKFALSTDTVSTSAHNGAFDDISFFGRHYY